MIVSDRFHVIKLILESFMCLTYFYEKTNDLMTDFFIIFLLCPQLLR